MNSTWKSLLYPHKGPQERELCLLPFLARWGAGGLSELQETFDGKENRKSLHRAAAVSSQKPRRRAEGRRYKDIRMQRGGLMQMLHVKTDRRTQFVDVTTKCKRCRGVGCRQWNLLFVCAAHDGGDHHQ